MTPNIATDDDLLRQLIAGDDRAFVALYRKYQATIYRFAFLICGRPNVAEDVTQEVFLTLIREPQRYDSSRGTLLSYLYGIARNHILRSLKRERAYIPLNQESEDENFSPPLISNEDPFRDYGRNEVVRIVRQAVLSLPPRYREVVVLCDFQDFSCADAAAALNCAVGTVFSRLNRGHLLLLKKLAAKGNLRLAFNAPPKGCFA
jgi:RNA polymerase sigma-70 factor, ECF subfamily